MGRASTLPLALIATAIAASWAVADPEQPHPSVPEVASPVPPPAASERLQQPPPAARVGGAFVHEPQSMADVHRLREQTAAATTEAIPDLRTLALTAADPIVVGCAVDALARLGALLGDEPLLSLARDARPRVRQQLAVALGRCGEGAVPLLRDLASGAGAEVLPLAIAALGRIGGRTARAALEEIARRGDLDVMTRSRLQDALLRAANPGHGRR